MFSQHAKVTMRWLFLAVTAFVALLPGLAQTNPPATTAGTCNAFVRTALDATDRSCTGTGRNEACYGNVLSSAVARDAQTRFMFEAQGDTAPLSDIRSLELSPLSLDEERWGVVLMQVQANLPGSLPGQNVTFLMFGDVEITNAWEPESTVVGATTQAANVRLAPSQTSLVLGALPRGSEIVAAGKYRNSAGETWIRIVYEDYRTRTGWVFSGLTDFELASLNDVPADSLAQAPMQAFYFRTGIGSPACIEAPPDGILIQTPRGAGLVNFTINGIEIAVGSTVFMDSRSETGNTCFYTLEGQANLRAANVSQSAPSGTQSCVPTDENGQAASSPSFPAPYEKDRMAGLSLLTQRLPEPFTELPEPRVVIPATVPPTAVPATAVPTQDPGADNSNPQPTVDPTKPVGPTPVPTAGPTIPPDPCFFDVAVTADISWRRAGATGEEFDIFKREMDCNFTYVYTINDTNPLSTITQTFQGQYWEAKARTSTFVLGFTVTGSGPFTITVP